MKIDYLFLNILRKLKTAIETAIAEAKDYSLSARKIDYSGTVYPLSTAATSPWTYTAPDDGVLYVSIWSASRVYCSIFVNGNRILDHAVHSASGTAVIPATVFLQKGDVVSINNLSANLNILTATSFVPFVVGG